jgi:hypothetical protein
VNAPRSEVGQRQVNQQQRIGNGIRSGQMSPGEVARAENQQQHINQQVHAYRQANDSTREPQRTPGAAVELKSLSTLALVETWSDRRSRPVAPCSLE